MNAPITYTARAETPEQTNAIAGSLARALRPGDGLLLIGDLGAGKTHFVRAAAAARGAEQEATSPTFGLVNIYDSPSGPIIHVDAYRLKDVDEFRRLGLDDYLEKGVGFIEWGERVAPDLSWYHRLSISVDMDVRFFTLATASALGTLAGWRGGEAP